MNNIERVNTTVRIIRHVTRTRARCHKNYFGHVKSDCAMILAVYDTLGVEIVLTDGHRKSPGLTLGSLRLRYLTVSTIPAT